MTADIHFQATLTILCMKKSNNTSHWPLGATAVWFLLIWFPARKVAYFACFLQVGDFLCTRFFLSGIFSRIQMKKGYPVYTKGDINLELLSIRFNINRRVTTGPNRMKPFNLYIHFAITCSEHFMSFPFFSIISSDFLLLAWDLRSINYL